MGDQHTRGRMLHSLWAACFNGGGWVDEAPAWEDFDEAGHVAWEANAVQIARNIKVAVAAPELLTAAERVIAAHDEVNAWMALGWPARTLVQEPNRNTARAAFDCLRAAIALATSPAPQPTEGNGG